MENIFKKDYNDLKYDYGDNIEYIRHELYRKIKPKLYIKMPIVKLLELIIDNFKSDFCEDNKEDLKRKIINHGNRVYKNMKMIVTNLELNEKIFLSKRDKFVLSVSCLLHDIGKVYKDKDHHIYSTIIVDYLLRLDNRFDEDLINDILDVIYNHSKKTKKKNKITILSKIMRDADLFDDLFFSSERLSSWFVHAGLFAVGKNVGICDSRFVRYFYLWHGRGGRQQPCRRL